MNKRNSKCISIIKQKMYQTKYSSGYKFRNHHVTLGLKQRKISQRLTDP